MSLELQTEVDHADLLVPPVLALEAALLFLPEQTLGRLLQAKYPPHYNASEHNPHYRTLRCFSIM
jgi:hypothetical protein